jgi:hypothetical protein
VCGFSPRMASSAWPWTMYPVSGHRNMDGRIGTPTVGAHSSFRGRKWFSGRSRFARYSRSRRSVAGRCGYTKCCGFSDTGGRAASSAAASSRYSPALTEALHHFGLLGSNSTRKRAPRCQSQMLGLHHARLPVPYCSVTAATLGRSVRACIKFWRDRNATRGAAPKSWMTTPEISRR